MKLTFLGTGTSHGVPVIGCKCPVCLSKDPRNRRTRSSILLENEGKNLLIDTATDFHGQAIREGLDHLEGILFTHAHADHIHGLDEVRIFTRSTPLPIYGSKATIAEICERFPYIFNETIQTGGGKPSLTAHILNPGEEKELCTIPVLPLLIHHGKLRIFGYRFGQTAYLTDCSGIPQESFDRLQGIETLIIGALRYRSHPTHFNLGESLGIIKALQPRRAYLTHMSHDFDHERLLNELKELPGGVEPAYDGLKIEID